VWVSRAYVEQVDIESITQRPALVQGRPGQVVYVISRRGGLSGERVVFRLKPRQAGLLRLRLGVVGGSEVALWQLVYP
jgi:hypothetical protein